MEGKKTKTAHDLVISLGAARLRKRAQAGWCEGRKPYGHREGEPVIVRRMRELRAKGLAYGAIAERMNQEELRAPAVAGMRE
jgi:hypothetical protein